MAVKQTNEEIIRERDFLKSKVQELTSRVRTLEYDCAELQRRESDLNYRLKDISNQRYRYNPNFTKKPVYNRR
jgi:chromosome segregation ATPase